MLSTLQVRRTMQCLGVRFWFDAVGGKNLAESAGQVTRRRLTLGFRCDLDVNHQYIGPQHAETQLCPAIAHRARKRF